MDWLPQEQCLNQILTFLKQTSSSDNNIQRTVQQRYEELRTYPDFNNYLIFIFTKMDTEDEATRSLSGILLKNNIIDYFSNINNLEFIKKQCLEYIGDRSQIVRSTISIIITTIVSVNDISTWPDLLPNLCTKIESLNEYVCDGAFNTLLKICEDTKDFEKLRVLVPIFIKFVTHNSSTIRSYAISCLLQFFKNDSNFMITYVDNFVRNLFQISYDTNVQKKICTSFITLLENQIDKLLLHIDPIIEFMLCATNDLNEDLALEASEFWLSLAEQEVCRIILEPHLVRLIPILVKNMKYSTIDLELLEENNASVPDCNEDIRPHFVRSRTKSFENYDDNDDVEEILSIWSLRKCSAATLDTLATVFKTGMRPILFPILKETLFHPNWLVKESAILALGAVVPIGLEDHLNELMPYLINCLNETPLIRAITCWTISRYSSWIVTSDFLENIIVGLLETILDENKGVQKAACSAFATFEEECQLAIVPYLETVIKTFVAAFAKYQHNNLLILYDAIATLAVSVDTHLNNPNFINLLMTPFIEKWNLLDDTDKNLSPLLECLASIVPALQNGFLPYCEPVYKRCICLLEKILGQEISHLEYPEQFEAPDKDPLIVSLDLLSGLAEGLKGEIEKFVVSSNVMQLLYYCIQDPLPDVRQAAFALLGDLTKACFDQVCPTVQNILPILTLNLDLNFVSVCNNATWALGEISMKLGHNIVQYIKPIVERLFYVITETTNQRALLENTAITVCRLAYSCPQEMAVYLNLFLRPCCRILRNIKDSEIKDEAFRGLCQMIARNPEAASNDFIFFCDAIASWIQPKEDLVDMFRTILQEFKRQFGEENWRNFTSQFPPQLSERISVFYCI